jgi:glycosyltransferase involved in cell wall biosynthesis
MSPPRVLLTTYHHAYLKKAGGEFELFSISEKLKCHGLIADVYGPFSRSLESYDVALHFSVHGGGLDLLQYIHSQGKPIALWPNLWLNEPAPQLATMVNAYIDLSRVVIFKSQAEQAMFSRFFELPQPKVRRVLTQADPIYRREAPSGLFRELYGLGRYAIGVGIIEPNKNQLSVIRALKGTGLKLVLVGGHRDESYYRTCQQEGADDVVFIDGLPARSELMRSALRESTLFIECSHEPPGLSSIEAGLAGCRLVVSDSPWTREHFADLAYYCDPGREESIQVAVQQALAAGPAGERLSEHLLPHCSETSVERVVDILRELSS